ncbi:MAG: glycosyl hydrolase [Solirubrobacteraceae bacterium]
MRLRLLVPRRRRRRSLRGLTGAIAGLAALGAALLAGCGSAEPAPPPPASERALAIGITEPNPAFLAPSGYTEFERWRPELAKLAPEHYRLVVEWDKAVAPDGSYDVTAEQGGCLRVIPPCGGWFGVRAQMEAVAAAQQASPGRYELMVVLMYTPPAYASPAAGCERRDVEPRSRPPQDLDAYRAVIRAVRAEADRAGVEVAQWSPWNEPNHPYFISPQRVRCDAAAPSAAVPAYISLARAMQAELVDGEQLVLGELAPTTTFGPQSTRMTEFVDGLPSNLVCAADVFGIHKYAQDDPIDALSAAIARHGCELPIWVTETGTKHSLVDPVTACETDRANLERWYEDPRVDAVFHYTLREDDVFPTGLITTDLAAAFPALAEWQAWGARTDPSASPPPSACR